MLPRYSAESFKCLLIAFVIVFVIVIYTYFVNLRRTADDPKKSDYDLLAVVVAPLTFPIFLFLAILVFILRAILFAGFLILFAFFLVLVRKPFIFKWWHNFATAIGDPLLKINTSLVRLAFNLGKANP